MDMPGYYYKCNISRVLDVGKGEPAAGVDSAPLEGPLPAVAGFGLHPVPGGAHSGLFLTLGLGTSFGG